MAPKSLILLGLLFAIVFVISSDVVSARSEPGVAESKGVEVDGHHHPCHHCSEEENNGNDAHHEEAEKEKVEDGHHEHEHEHEHMGHHCHHPHC